MNTKVHVKKEYKCVVQKRKAPHFVADAGNKSMYNPVSLGVSRVVSRE
jgi:hypothetical protein